MKKQIKKVIPATYGKIESANAKLLKEIDAKIEARVGASGNIEKELKRVEKQVLQKEQYTLERTRQICRELEEIRGGKTEEKKQMEEILSKERRILDKGNQFLDKGNQILNRENQILNKGNQVLDMERQILDAERQVLDTEKQILKEQNKAEAQAEANQKEIMASVASLRESTEEIPHKYLYNNAHERKIIQSFHQMYDRPDYKEHFMRLMKGLDNETKAEIVKILQRQQLVRGHEGEAQDIFSREEQEQIQEVKRQLTQEVFRVADDLYCYKHYFLPVNHFEPSVFIYRHGLDCVENLNSLRNKDIIDVGGFVGDSILVLKPLTDRRVVSFEGISQHYEIMKKTVELNELDHVILENMALGGEVGTARMEYAGSSSAFHTNGVVTVRGTEQVRVETLDHYMEGKDLDIGLIKVDIEGAEQEFLRGARKTIEAQKPVLLMSIYHNADDFFHIKPMIESWDLGYKFRIHKPTDYSVSREVLLICEVR